MKLVTIKDHRTDGLVALETYDTDTEAVGGFVVNVSDLQRWLRQSRPCQVYHEKSKRPSCPSIGWSAHELEAHPATNQVV